MEVERCVTTTAAGGTTAGGTGDGRGRATTRCSAGASGTRGRRRAGAGATPDGWGGATWAPARTRGGTSTRRRARPTSSAAPTRPRLTTTGRGGCWSRTRGRRATPAPRADTTAGTGDTITASALARGTAGTTAARRTTIRASPPTATRRGSTCTASAAAATCATPATGPAGSNAQLSVFDHDDAGLLVRGQPLAADGAHGSLVQLGAAGDHGEHDVVLLHRVGDGAHAGLRDARILLQRALHLARVDVEAAAREHLLQHPAEAHRAVALRGAQVAGAEGVVPEERRVAPFVADVAGEDVGALHADLPRLPRIHHPSARVADAHVHAGEGVAQRSRAVGAVDAVEQAARRALGDPVPLAQRHAEALPEAPRPLAPQRRAAADGHAQPVLRHALLLRRRPQRVGEVAHAPLQLERRARRIARQRQAVGGGARGLGQEQVQRLRHRVSARSRPGTPGAGKLPNDRANARREPDSQGPPPLRGGSRRRRSWCSAAAVERGVDAESGSVVRRSRGAGSA